MAEAPWIKFYVSDYLSDTGHLNTEQHGAYLLLLMTMWRAGGVLPNDPIKLARFAKLPQARWDRMASVILDFFSEVEGGITQKRLARELENVRLLSKMRSNAGSFGGIAKSLKNKEAPVANAMHLPNKTEANAKQVNGYLRGRESQTQTLEVIPPYPPQGGIQQLQSDGASPPRIGAREEPAQQQKVFDHGSANDLERRLRDAAGYGASPAPGLLVTGPIETLLDEGFDLEREILPAIAARAKTMNGAAGSWKYFVGAIRQYRETLRRASAQGASSSATARSAEATLAALIPPTPEQIRARRIEAYRRRGIDPDTERGRREILIDCIRAPSVEDRCDIGRIPIPAEWIRQNLMVEENAAAIMCFAPDIAITKILFDRFSDRDGSRQGLNALWEAMRARGHTADSLREAYLSDGLALPDSGPLAAKR